MVRLLLLALANTVLYLMLGFASELPSGTSRLPSLGAGDLFEASSEFLALWLALVLAFVGAIRTVAGRDGRTIANLILLSSAVFRGAVFLGAGFDVEARPSLLWAPSPMGEGLAGLLGEEWLRRAVVTACDLVTLAVSASLLRDRKLPAGLLVLHGWNPLVIKEAAGSGRVALVALLLLVVALRLARTGASRLATAALAVSATGPGVLLAAVPALSRTLGARVLVVIAAAGASRYLAFGDPSWATWVGWPPADGLGASLSACLAVVASLLVTRDPWAPVFAGIAAWAAIVAWKRFRDREEEGRAEEALLGVGGLMLVLPQILPEAFVAVGCLAPYSRNRGWVALTVTAPVTYVAMETGWSFYLGFAQYFVPFFLLVFFWLGSPPRRAAG